MGVRFDFSDINRAIRQTKAEVRKRYEEIGQKCVDYAVANGTYHDVTGNLRRSNRYRATEDGLILENTADYASDVENRGKDVISGAIMEMRKELAK